MDFWTFNAWGPNAKLVHVQRAWSFRDSGILSTAIWIWGDGSWGEKESEGASTFFLQQFIRQTLDGSYYSSLQVYLAGLRFDWVGLKVHSWHIFVNIRETHHWHNQAFLKDGAMPLHLDFNGVTVVCCKLWPFLSSLKLVPCLYEP